MNVLENKGSKNDKGKEHEHKNQICSRLYNGGSLYGSIDDMYIKPIF